jgi:hypothetical protein
MDIVREIANLDGSLDLHSARLLILVHAFAGPSGDNRVSGLTKLAKLDFLLRYPTMLAKALKAKGKTASSVALQPYEEHSVESSMVRYRFGPWDHRYRLVLNALVARRLVDISIEGRTIAVGVTQHGRQVAQSLAALDAMRDVAKRARLLAANFDIKATALMRFIYKTFPEVVSLSKNQPIRP